MMASEIIKYLPYSNPFLFVDALTKVTDTGVTGHYTFPTDSDFYQGHFKDNPVTPGVILTECCAQIGLVCLGIHQLGREQAALKGLQIGMSSSEMEFTAPVWPGEQVIVSSEMIYFRFHKLKCKVKMHNAAGTLVCRGVLSGMLKINTDG